MIVLLVILVALVAVSAAGALWDLLGSRRGRQRRSLSDAEHREAQGKVDYYAKVWDSSNH